MPPHHTGMLRAAQTSWTFFASVNPPTRPTLMLMMRQAPISTAPGRIAGVVDGFVQADRGPQLLLQAGVVVDVVVPQRLLDHQQIELVELAQVFEFDPACRRSWRRNSA